MNSEVLELLKVHDYFHGLSDETLREVASLGQLVVVPAGTVVQEADQPLTSIGFVLKGRLKAIRLDSQGHEHFFRTMDRGEQFGLMMGALGGGVPLRIVALEPSTILSLDYEQSMELPLKYPDLRRQWLRDVRPEPPAALFRRHAGRRTPNAGGSPRIPRDAAPGPQTRQEIARVGRRGLRAQRFGRVALDPGCEVPLADRRRRPPAIGRHSPTDHRLASGHGGSWSRSVRHRARTSSSG